jgi:hypothetical protein
MKTRTMTSKSKGRISRLSVVLVFQFLIVGTAFLTPPTRAIHQRDLTTSMLPPTKLFSSSSEVTPEMERNSIYVRGLMENLSGLCDKYIVTGSEQVVSF